MQSSNAEEKGTPSARDEYGAAIDYLAVFTGAGLLSIEK